MTDLLRHSLATLAYRAAKTMRDAPADFPSFDAGQGTRTPLHIVSHMGDLMAWAVTMARGEEKWVDATSGTWEGAVDRFHQELAAFDAYLTSGAVLGASPERLLQGPIADALTHVGQLAMLRRMAGSRIKGENYFRAEVTEGRLGPDQAAPRREF